MIVQSASNYALLLRARRADYNRVATELRQIIPSNATVYGTITFWLAFHEQSYISDERTEPLMAAREYSARYFILGDRVMASGTQWDPEFSRSLEEQLAQIVGVSQLVGNIPDDYYGDLKIYRTLH